MSENKIIFDSVIFDKVEKTFTIIDGNVGVYSYKEVIKCSILGEDARYRGKSEPFTHVASIGGFSTTPQLIQPNLYVGLKITMKDKQILGIYISKEKTRENTFQYRNDIKEAEKIKRIFDQCIHKYK